MNHPQPRKTLAQKAATLFYKMAAQEFTERQAERKIMDALDLYKSDRDLYAFAMTVENAFSSRGLDFTAFYVGKKENNPLHEAIKLNDEPLFDYLLEKGVDVNAFDGKGWSPLRQAIKVGNESMVIKLLNSKDIDICPLEVESVSTAEISQGELIREPAGEIAQNLTQFAQDIAGTSPERQEIYAIMEKAQKNGLPVQVCKKVCDKPNDLFDNRFGSNVPFYKENIS